MFEFLRKEDAGSVNVNDLEGLKQPIHLIDIREVYEYQRRSLSFSKNIPMGDLLTSPERHLKKEETYYIMCQSGGRSERCVKELKKLGYQVINVSGGMGAYAGTKLR